MKANEAPESVYLALNVFGDIIKDQWQFHRLHDDDIEYTRTDAFIIKAKKWFEKQNEWHDPNGNRHCDMESFDDFVKYMKGE